MMLYAKTNRSVFHYAGVLNPRGVDVPVVGSTGPLLQALLLVPIDLTVQQKAYPDRHADTQ